MKTARGSRSSGVRIPRPPPPHCGFARTDIVPRPLRAGCFTKVSRSLFGGVSTGGEIDQVGDEVRRLPVDRGE